MADDDLKEEKKSGLVVEETAEGGSEDPKAEIEDPQENETGSVFGGRDFASSSFDQGGGSKKKILLIVLAVLVGIGLVAGGFWVYNSKIKPATTAPTPSPEIIPEPSPTPKVEVDVSAYKTRVLNGSGTPGKAGTVKDILEKEGFKDVGTANAKSFDYTETKVSMKESVAPAVFEKIKKTLVGYTVVQGDSLEDSDTYDITITVGSTE